jgi:hypothetical protein
MSTAQRQLQTQHSVHIGNKIKSNNNSITNINSIKANNNNNNNNNNTLLDSTFSQQWL